MTRPVQKKLFSLQGGKIKVTLHMPRNIVIRFLFVSSKIGLDIRRWDIDEASETYSKLECGGASVPRDKVSPKRRIKQPLYSRLVTRLHSVNMTCGALCTLRS